MVWIDLGSAHTGPFHVNVFWQKCGSTNGFYSFYVLCVGERAWAEIVQIERERERGRLREREGVREEGREGKRGGESHEIC